MSQSPLSKMEAHLDQLRLNAQHDIAQLKEQLAALRAAKLVMLSPTKEGVEVNVKIDAVTQVGLLVASKMRSS